MVRRLLFLGLLGAIGAFFFRSFLFEGIYLATDSMAPTFPEGRHVFVNKAAFHFRAPRRGDVVMFVSPQEPDKGLVKRVIAVAGDTIELKQKKVYLNGALVEEPYAQFLRADVALQGDTLPPVRVPEGMVFVMGDNRDVSRDSRDWKDADGNWSPFVPVDAIRGLVRAGSASEGQP